MTDNTKTTDAPVDDNSLFEAIEAKDWGECRALLKRKDAFRLARYEDQGTGTSHWACERDAPIDVLEAIYSVHPESFKRRCGHGWTCLHYASTEGRQSTLEFLLTVAPRSAVTAGLVGHLPLHVAVEMLCDPPFVRRLLVANPGAVRAVEHLGDDTPLELLLRNWSQEQEAGFPSRSTLYYSQVFSLLLMVHARGKVVEDDSDPSWLLAHETIRYFNTVSVPTPFVCAIIRTSVRCARPDASGAFPLHVACAISRRIGA